VFARPSVTAQSTSGCRLLHCDANGMEMTNTSLCASDNRSILFTGVLTELYVQKNYSEQRYSCFLCLSDEVPNAIMLWNALTSLVFLSFNAGMHRLLKKIKNHLKILDAKRATSSKFHIEGPRILGATKKYLFATAS
jgi:hypothetical protein